MTNNNWENRQSAPTISDNLKFGCSLSKKAVKHNMIEPCISFAPVLVFSGFVCIATEFWVLLFGIIIFFTFLFAFNIWNIEKLKEGYMEITTGNELKRKFFGFEMESFPIKEIKSIEAVSLEQAKERRARFPYALNNNRWEALYPENGVLITFNRSWIKSVFPVYFNPADIEGFIDAIKQRMS